MPITVTEKFESRQGTTGANPSVVLTFNIEGTSDDVDARRALLDESPETFQPYGPIFPTPTNPYTLVRQDISIEPLGEELWKGLVTYGQFTATGESDFSFETSGGIHHISQSKQTVASYPSGAPDFKGAIGVTADSIEGADIIIPVYEFSETHYFAPEDVTPDYKGILYALTGKTNNAPFKGFAAGEVLFYGASGSRRGYGDWELFFRFAASPNVVGLTIGDIAGIDKGGWEYLWIRYVDDVDDIAKALVKIPSSVHVERVYDSGNFSLLGIDD